MDCYEAIDLMGDELDGRLSRESRAGFDEHLGECEVCRTYLDQLRTTVQSVERLPRPNFPSGRRSELIAAFRRERSKDR